MSGHGLKSLTSVFEFERSGDEKNMKYKKWQQGVSSNPEITTGGVTINHDLTKKGKTKTFICTHKQDCFYSYMTGI